MTNEEFKIALIHIKRHIYSKPIKKYIDPEVQEHDQKEGKAPTMDNIEEFFYCDIGKL